MDKDLFDLSEIRELIGQLSYEYKRRLLEGDKYTSRGTLINSIEGKVYFRGKYLVVSLMLEDYWEYVEDGRKAGSFPPVDKIKEWIKIKPILPRQITYSVLHKPKTKNWWRSSKTIIPTENQLAYLIGRKIKKEGIKPTHYLAESIQSTNIVEIISENVKKQIIDNAAKIWKEEIESIRKITLR